MLDLQDKKICPTLEEIAQYVQTPAFMQLCQEIKGRYECGEQIEFSACSLARGWNVKFKKAGRTLCTIYPHELYFTVMVVVGRREKAQVEAVLPDCTAPLREIYRQTREGNGQRWLMIDVEDQGDICQDILRLIAIRRSI